MSAKGGGNVKMEVKDNVIKIYEDTYERWRKAIFRANEICVGIILFMEFLVWLLLEYQGLRNQPLLEYLIRFMFLPTITNVLILFIGYRLIKRYDNEERTMNYVPVLQMVCLCTSVSLYHNLFDALLCTFGFPIFMTVMFNDKRMTRNVATVCVIGLVVVEIFGPIVGSFQNEYQIASCLIGLSGLGCTSVICNVLIQFQEQRDKKLENMYQSRTEALEKLKYDQKTGLYAHTTFQTGLKELVESGNQGTNPAVAVLDIDDFKRVNDTYGHLKGDRVLMELAEILRRVCGEDYIAARFGGEEFAILFRNGTIEQYIEVVETIRQEFEKVRYEFWTEAVTLSAGIALWKNGWDSTEFFNRADEALYISKRQGKNRTTVSDDNGIRTV